MNLKQLQFAVEVARTHSFSQAAERCCVTQPTLSNGIAQLEEELGGKLFKRTTRKVELTDFGEHLLPSISDVIHSRDTLIKSAQAYHNPQHKILRIGFSPLVNMQRLDQALSLYRQTHPEVTVYFKECFLDDLSQRLETGQIDLCIVPARETEKGETNFHFYEDNWRYLPAHDDEQASNHLSFEVSKLPTTPIILTGGGCGLNAAVKTLLEENHSELNEYPGQAVSYKAIEDWTALGIGAAILPQAKLTLGETHSQALFIGQDRPATIEYDWIWRTDQTHASQVIEFIDYVQSTVPALLKGQDQKQAAKAV